MRIGTLASYRRVLGGLRENQFNIIRAQEQLSSGRRISRPSDDPTGSSRALRFERQISDVERYRKSIDNGGNITKAGSAALTQASGLITEARELLLQGLNGTLTDEGRVSIASEIDLIRTQLLEISNTKSGDLYVFGGTETSKPPFEERGIDGRVNVEYRGNDAEQFIRAGDRSDVAVSLNGGDVFGRFEPGGALIGGITGVTGGSTADQGSGQIDLTLRHDQLRASDLANLQSSLGLNLVNGGSQDSFLGDAQLVIDTTANTIQFGGGPVQPIPATPLPNDLTLTNAQGGELHLDFSGYNGAGFNGSLRGEGSASIDGVNFTSLGDFSATDLELQSSQSDTVLHINTTGAAVEGKELVEFQGTTNLFDMLQQVADDLENVDGVDANEVRGRLSRQLKEVDRHHNNVLVGVGVLGSRTRRLELSGIRATEVETSLQGLLSEVQDTDLAEVALDLSRSQFLLQLAQQAGSRLLQTSLVSFLR